MENWKLWLVVVTFCALLQTYQALSSREGEERGLSPDWQDESLEESLISLMKRSNALRFYGLMGKRSEPKKPFKVNRRNKGEAFVGLMGRSISSGESLKRIFPATTTAFDVSEKPRKQGSSEEWVHILY
ncbi:hypothetical protein OYC64_001506 [Pagothenia borchgrevinki]|uniref:Uncharacterized protein n=1 Tax=Pagothenia borchgrevinki TaxID=8213 RepID=A0ABD2GD00_PAGBO